MSFGNALYYPQINLTNKNWIKHALLFWDKISRIVPSSVEPSDNEDIIRIKYEIGFIKDYYPDSYDTSKTFVDFSEELERIVGIDNFFRNRYYEPDSKPIRESEKDPYSKYSFALDEDNTNGTYIHVTKLDQRFKDFFINIGVAIPGKNIWEDWIKIDNEIGLLYMTYFAKTISKRMSLPIVTDIVQSFSAAIHFESKINTDYSDQFEYRLGNLLIETIVPKNINDVPLDKLLEIRRKYDWERTAFFNEISSLTNTIIELNSARNLEDALNHHSKLILKETQNLEKLYNTHKIETVNKFLSISLPTTIASSSEYIPDIAKPIVAAGGILFGIVSTANSVKKERLELKNNPKSYLLNLKSELSSRDIFNKVNDTIKGIRKW